MPIQVTNTLTAVLTSTEDSTGNVFINRGTGNPAVDSETGLFIAQFVTLGANVDTAIPTLSGSPGNEIDQLYIKNNDNAAIITVKWTPSGGAAATIIKLQPGGQIIVWEPVTGSGMKNVTIASDIGGTNCEIFIGSITA